MGVEGSLSAEKFERFYRFSPKASLVGLIEMETVPCLFIKYERNERLDIITAPGIPVGHMV